MKKEAESEIDEKAIMVTLLSVPSFREKAGLPPLNGNGDSLELLAILLDCTPGRVSQIINTACRKLYAAALNNPELFRELLTYINNHDK